MKLKKLAALLMAATLTVTALAGCGGDNGNGGGGGGKTTITIFNTKSEITEYLEAAAAEYEKLICIANPAGNFLN